MDLGFSGTFQQTLWRNFGAVIDMLDDIVKICPEEVWQKENRIYYMTYHTVIFLDYYLTRPVAAFRPILPYHLADTEKLPAGAVDDVIPDKHYTREEVRACIASARAKCRKLCLQDLSVMNVRWILPEEVDLHGLCPGLVVNYSIQEILFYNFRHVQHHVGQLNMLLREKAGVAADWVAMVE
jgi:hypothetical protein